MSIRAERKAGHRGIEVSAQYFGRGASETGFMRNERFSRAVELQHFLLGLIRAAFAEARQEYEQVSVCIDRNGTWVRHFQYIEQAPRGIQFVDVRVEQLAVRTLRVVEVDIATKRVYREAVDGSFAGKRDGADEITPGVELLDSIQIADEDMIVRCDGDRIWKFRHVRFGEFAGSGPFFAVPAFISGGDLRRSA